MTKEAKTCPVCGSSNITEIGEDAGGNLSYGCNNCLVMFTIHPEEYGEPGS